MACPGVAGCRDAHPPLPGTNRKNLRAALRDLHSKVSTLRGGRVGHAAMDVLSAYLQWVNEAARVLHNQVSASDVDRLVLTTSPGNSWGRSARQERPKVPSVRLAVGRG
jgi:hypothetical protein